MTCEEVKRSMELPLEWHTSDELREMWRHIGLCEDCSRAFGWQFQLWWLMQDAMEEPPPGLAERIMIDVKAAQPDKVRSLPWWRRRKALAALAAALAIAVFSPVVMRAVQSGMASEQNVQQNVLQGQTQDSGVTGPVASSFLLSSPAEDTSDGGFSEDGGKGAEGTALGLQQPGSFAQESENAAIAGNGGSDRTSPVAENDLFVGTQGAWRTYAAAKHMLVDWRAFLPTEFVKDPSQVTLVLYVTLPPENYIEHVENDAADCYVLEAVGGYALYLVQD